MCELDKMCQEAVIVSTHGKKLRETEYEVGNGSGYVTVIFIVLMAQLQQSGRTKSCDETSIRIISRIDCCKAAISIRDVRLFTLFGR
jgi:hypothetical protein